MRYCLALLCALVLLAICPQARAEKRVALVMGNSSYENTATLKNPKNDAADMAALLKKLGFEVVEGVDLDKRRMERAIRDFGVKLAGADLAFFFYAGHGLQVNGKNYMVPTDARLAVEGDVDFEVLELPLVLKQMEREAPTRVVLLDACRDNPLTRSLRSGMAASRSGQLGQGLAKLDRTLVGTLIGYSTEPGSVASDGDGRNSPYTQALLTHLDAAGKDLSSILNAVRGEVVKATAGQQVPWESTSLLGPVYLKQDAPKALDKPADAVAKVETKPAEPAAVKQDSSVEVAFWNSIKDTKVPLELQIYLDRYPSGAYADLARVRLDQLRAAEAASKVASVTSKSVPGPAADPLALPRSVQTELKRVGCYAGATDGRWSEDAREALGRFVRLSRASVPTSEPSEAALSALLRQTDRVCPLDCGAGMHEVDGKCVVKRARDLVRKPGQQEVRRPRDGKGEEKGEKERMCWNNTPGRSGDALVSCSAPSAGRRAF